MIKIASLFLSLFLFFQDESVPLKPSDEFELKIDYTFRQRPMKDTNTVNLSETKKTSAGPLPFLSINFKAIKLQPEESRLKIISNIGDVVMNRKITEQQLIKFDMGFTVDLKERVKPHEYTIYFLSSDKAEKSKIIVSVEEDGTFLVNQEKRGKL